MNTVEQILAEAARTIARIHHRPLMYVGTHAQLGAANTLDAVMWMAHWFWATVQSREQEFRIALDAIHRKHHCRSEGFPDAFRRDHPQADESATFAHVLQCWAEVDHCLHIDISQTATTA